VSSSRGGEASRGGVSGPGCSSCVGRQLGTLLLKAHCDESHLTCTLTFHERLELALDVGIPHKLFLLCASTGLFYPENQVAPDGLR